MKVILNTIILVLFFSLAKGQTKPGVYTLNGTITALKMPTRVYLQFTKNGRYDVASAEVKDGKFQLSDSINRPMRGVLILDHTGLGSQTLNQLSDSKVVYLEEGNINLIAGDSVKYAAVTGTTLNVAYPKYAAAFAAEDKASAALIESFNTAARLHSDDKAYASAFLEKLNTIAEQKTARQLAYSSQNPNSYFSLEALIDAAAEGLDVGQVSPRFEKLSPALRKSPGGLDFAKLIEDSRPTSIGAIAPDFTQNDVNDKPISLSDFRGKYVLLDFWASWCHPCRDENPKVVKAYQAFKDKNFTVLSVSLDQPTGKAAWLAAIQKDGLTWTHVSDLKFWNNAVSKQYGIKSIPQNLLIDPKGKIVGKNLHGDDLIAKLTELLDSK